MSAELSASLLTDTIPEEPKPKSGPMWTTLVLVCTIGLYLFILFVLFFISAKPWNTHTILYLNDIHVDWLYSPTGQKSSETCHTSGKSNVAHPYGIYGCDAPGILFESAVQAMKTNYPNPDMIILGGDYVTYTIDADVDEVKNTTKYVYNVVKKSFPNTPIHSIIGNAEYAPDYGYYHNSTDLYREYSKILEIPKDQVKNFDKCANYYIDYPKHNQRYIFINTVIYNKWHNYTNPDTGITFFPEDPCDQFAWFEKVLEEGKKKGLKNAVIMHVPSAISFYDYNDNMNSTYADKLFQILQKYPPEYMLCGHTHVDLMLPMFNDHNNTELIALSSVAITPQHYNNPGFRVYESSKGKLIDYTQFIADISFPTDKIEWIPEYSFSDVYKTNDISLKSILSTIKYIQNNHELSSAYLQLKDGRARSDLPFYTCLLSSANSNEVRKCVDSVGVKNAREALGHFMAAMGRQ